MSWKCKKCGGDRFYRPYIGLFVNIKANKDQDIIESEDRPHCGYGKFCCDKCKKSGWTLDEVAEWVEE